MISCMDIRIVLFSFLLDLPHEKRKEKIEQLKRDKGEEDYNKFSNWCKETMEIGEDELGETFPDDFKELFN